MYLKENITNEMISKKFSNQFNLVNYAIDLTENLIKTGRAPRTELDSENPALQALEEIACGSDRFDEVVVVKLDEAALIEKNKQASLDLSFDDDDDEDDEEEEAAE